VTFAKQESNYSDSEILGECLQHRIWVQRVSSESFDNKILMLADWYLMVPSKLTGCRVLTRFSLHQFSLTFPSVSNSIKVTVCGVSVKINDDELG